MNSTFYFTYLLIITIESFAASIYPDICLNKQCYQKDTLPATIEKKTNKSLHFFSNACQNFYTFSCGTWISRAERPPFEILWNHWHEASHNINSKIRNILERESLDSPALRKARFMYNTCLHVERDYTDELLLLCKALGGWPIAEDVKALTEYKWPLKIVQITRLVNAHPLLKIHVDVNYRNSSKYLIYIDSGDLIMPTYILGQPETHLHHLVKYKEWIINTIKLIYPHKMLPRLNEEVDDLIALEVQLAKLAMDNTTRELMSVRDLTKKTNISWSEVLKVLFDGSGIEIRKEDRVVVCLAFINNLVHLLEKINPRTIANYVTWHLVKELSRDVSSSLRYENFRINSAILGIEEDYPVNYECAIRVAEYFQFAIVRKYADLFIPADAVNKVRRIAEEIKSEFVAILERNRWFSIRVIERAVKKVASVRILIGFPKWLTNKRNVENFYRNIRVTNNHFLNVIHLKERNAKYALQKLALSGKNIFRWPSNLFDVNAYYNPLQNSIIISLGLLTKPFFDVENPAALNYGALGSLIGHELSHSLDTFGREFVKSEKGWWTDSDAKNYQTRTTCLKERYSQYNIDGQQTIMENIADNVGLELSFRAYRRNNAVDLKANLPSKDYSWYHLFFISYAQMWCEVMGSKDEFLNQEEHAPVQFRVRGAVSNNVYYRKIFRCEPESENDTCALW